MDGLAVIEITKTLVKITKKPYEEFIKIVIMSFSGQCMDWSLHANNAVVEY